jgi:hypothetical protein
MNIQRILSIVVCACVGITSLYSYEVTALSATQWQAEGGYFNDVAVLSIPAESLAPIITWRNTDSEDPLLDEAIQYQQQLRTGNWTWYDYHNENSFSFVVTNITGVWEDAIGDDVWTYSIPHKRWTQTVGGTAVWAFNSTTGCFVYNPTGAAVSWRWQPELGVWRHIISDSTWRYDFVLAEWTEISNPDDVVLAIKPPLPLVQQMYSMMVANAFFAAGVVAESGKADWTVETSSSGLMTILNSSDDFSVAYNSSFFNSSVEGRLLGPVAYTQGKVTCSYSHASGDFSWLRTLHPLWLEQWTFVGGTNVWTDSQIGDVWEYDADHKRWSQEAGDTWQYDAAVDRWYKNDDEAVWRYVPASGYWEHTADAVTWRYKFLLLSSSWLQITTHEGEPEAGLPPIVVVHKTLIDSLHETVRLAEGFEVGVPAGWGVFTLDNEVWSTQNSNETQTVSYMPHLDTLMWQGASSDETFQYSLVSGSWQWNNAIDTDDVYTSEYNGLTGEWFENGVDLATWIFNDALCTWSDQTTDVVWTLTPGGVAWVHSDTLVGWTYSPADATWTEDEHDSVWKYCTTGRFWKKISGDGSGVTDDIDLPPLPLVESLSIKSAAYAVLVQGSEVVAARRKEIILSQVEGETDIVEWAELGHHITVYMRGEDEPSIEYTRDDEYLAWTLNPDTGVWTATQVLGEDILSWSFDPETAKWTGGSDEADSWTLLPDMYNAGSWINDADISEKWQYEHETNRWYDAQHQIWWSYDPQLQVWVDVDNSAVWSYDWRAGMWSQLYGSFTEGTVKPPLVVVQVAFISGVLDAIAYAGHLSVGDITGIEFERQEDGTWLGSTESNTFLFTFDSQSVQSPLTAALDTENHAEWLSNRVKISIKPRGDWRWEMSANPFAPEIYEYDSYSHQWSNQLATHGDVWEYDFVASTWTNQDDLTRWIYDRDSGRWTDETHDVEWSYDLETGIWKCWENVSLWQYDGTGNRWIEISDEGVIPHFPPRVVAQSALVYSLLRVVIDAGALQNSAVFEWAQTQQSWYGIADDSTGIARYDARKAYSITWTDSSGRNQVLYNADSGAWKWRGDNYIYSFNPTLHEWKVALRDFGVSWFYATDDDSTTWTSGDDETEVWEQGDSVLVWHDILGDVEWTYDEINGTWSTPTTVWGYHFATQCWYEISTEGNLPERFPPLPLVQQLFLVYIAASLNSFFDQPLYAGARVTTEAFEHPLYGSRPLEKNAYYQRYNTPALLVNAPVTLDNVWLIHSDVSRNLGKVQLPQITTRALPFIVGGERAFLNDQSSGPTITLLDSTIACHESLVASGVRFVVPERPASYIQTFGGVENNNSSLMIYRRGRAYDGPLRRGLVFQLGSTANRMLDGTVVDSLQNAYIDIYRSSDTAQTDSDLKSEITLSLANAPEIDVADTDRSISTLFIAHDSNIRIGWPSPVASELYVPSTIPLTGIMSGDAGSFDPGFFGGGMLFVQSPNWCLSGCTSDGMPPQLVTTTNEGAVVYVEYGGALAVADGADVIIDTTVAARSGYDDRAGEIVIPRDQLLITEYGKIQKYGADFVHGGQTTGPYAGHVRVSGEHSSLVLGKPFYASTVTPTKRVKRRKR